MSTTAKTWMVSAILVLAALLLMAMARASPSCMTKNEARRHWPRAHIYWHGPGHCWDNRKGRRREYRDPVFSKKVATVSFHAPDPAPEPVYRPMTFAPDIDANLRFLPWEQRIAGSF
jgi:hypothetical protein